MRATHAILAVALMVTGVGASAAAPTKEDQLRAELAAAWDEAGKAATQGPADIALLDQAHLHIDAGQAFVPAAPANRLMHALGNVPEDGRLGLVVPTDQKRDWMADLTWVKDGYVRDGDAKEWQPDAMLEEIRRDTETANSERIRRGFPALDLVGWVQPPAYDDKRHHLVWSLALRDRGAPAADPQTINYNTFALGREGYLSLDMLSGSDTIAADKPVAHRLLGGLTFERGKAYADFDASTDKIAKYGLAALVGVAASKKLGVLALIGVFLLKVWKLGLVALIGATAAVRRFFGRRGEPPAAG